jgi:predicted nuclease of predicted toxin-antitoxin system
MARALRFHLDEVCDPRIAVALRQRGIDVSTAKENGLLGASDEGHLAFAWSQARIIVTHDADFLRLHAAGGEHFGIIFSRPRARPLGELIRLLVLLWELVEPDEMRGHVEYL